MMIPFTLRKRLLASTITAVIAGGTCIPTISWAQSADAALRGKAPADSDITAKNIATGATRRTKAAADGSYALVGLPPGTYAVDAGPGTEKTVTLTVASTATLDFAGPTPTPTATTTTTLAGVSVNASTLAEVKTSEVGSTISLHQISTVPQMTRNFLEFADTIPGMIFTTDSTGHTSLQGGAMNTSSVNVFIDGVGQKSYVKEGGVSGQFSSQGNPFPQLAIGEYKVITSNYKAEYDQVSSAAVTAVTKSGTNEFHGDVFGNYTDDGWRDETPGEKAAGKKTQSQQKEYGFDIGGPIIKDQMHFFLTWEHKSLDTPTTVVPGVAGVTDLLPADARAALGPANDPFTEDLYFAKIDWELSDRDRIDLSGQYRDENTVNNVGGVNAASAGIQTKNTDKRYEARWEHSADAWVNELLFTYENAFNVPQPIATGVGAAYTFGPVNDGLIVQLGAPDPRAGQNKGQKGPGIKDDLTFNSFSWYGDHVIKTGIKFKDVKLTAQDAGDSSAQAFFNVCPLDSTDPACPPGTGATPYKATFPVIAQGFNPEVTSKDRQFGAYIQDDWAVNDKLTLNLGLRWDIEWNPSYLDWVTPANVVAALNAPNPDPNAPPGQTYAQALALGGVNINDYISNGHNRHAYDGEWQPRLGFSYDLNGDEQHVVFGGAGRSYDRDLYDYLQLEQTKFVLGQSTFYFSSPSQACKGNPCVSWDPSYLTLGGLESLVQFSNAGQEYDAINNNLKVPYSDQFSLGMRNKIGDWNTSAAVARIVSKDGFVFTLGNRYPNGAFWQDGSQPWGHAIPGFGALIIGNNGIETRTTQVLLSADKPYTKESGWAANIAYTYTKATQNRSITEHYAFDEATIQDYPFILSNAAPKHRLVVTGSIDGPWDFVVSGKLTLATPIPKDDYINYAFPVTAPNGANSLPIGGVPSGKSFLGSGPIFGYRSVDLQATKTFDLTHGMSWYLRADVLNALNYKNLVDISTTYPTFFPIAYNSTGNITGFPRTLKLSIGFKW